MSEQVIRAGLAVRTINPPAGLPLIGYPQGRPNVGVAMDLSARAVVFGNDAGPAAAMLTLDTIEVFPELVQAIRLAAAKQITGLEPATVMVIATHTHSAPTLSLARIDPQYAAPATSYIDATVKAVVATLADAWTVATPVRVRVGLTELRLGHNRRVVDAAGRAENVWLDPDGLHRGYFNPNVRVLVLEDVVTNQPRGVLWVHGCHPVTLGPGNPHASADYPGHARRRVEATLPGCIAMHLTGAAAQINPRAGLFDEPEKAAAFGDALAAVVLAEISRTRVLSTASVSSPTQSLELPLRSDSPENLALYGERATGSAIRSELQVIRLGELALIGLPGEIFAEIGVAVENSSPSGATFVAGYANDNLGYLCTDAACREGGYEARAAIATDVESRLTDAARLALRQLA